MNLLCGRCHLDLVFGDLQAIQVVQTLFYGLFDARVQLEVVDAQPFHQPLDSLLATPGDLTRVGSVAAHPAFGVLALQQVAQEFLVGGLLPHALAIVDDDAGDVGSAQLLR